MESNCRLRKDHAGITLPAELHEEARTRKLSTSDEIGYGQAHEAISDFPDSLAEHERREYTDGYSWRIVPFQD
jgi:hypothetical protein